MGSFAVQAVEAALPPELPMLEVGGSARGEITDDDPIVETELLRRERAQVAPTVGKSFRIQVEEPGTYQIDLRSHAFDAYLVLRDASGQVLKEDDDGPASSGLHSRVVVELAPGETYQADACALHGRRGRFEIQLRSGRPSSDPAIDAPDDGWLRSVSLPPVSELPRLEVGDSIHAEVAGGDPVIVTEFLDRERLQTGVIVGKRFTIRVEESGTYHIDLRSYSFDAYLVLRDASGQVLAEDDDGLVNLHSRVVFDLVAGETYRADACALHGRRGKLEIELHPGRPLDRSLTEVASAGREDVRRWAASLDNAPEDITILRSRDLLGETLHTLGEYAAAREQFESVLAGLARVRPGNEAAALYARGRLALTLSAMGDLDGARVIQESVVVALERTLPEDHPNLLRARTRLATSMDEMGDLPGARTIRETLLAVRERTLPEDHPDILFARASLASSMLRMGDLLGGRALLEVVLTARERTLPKGHPDLLATRTNLAVAMQGMGDPAGARALLEVVLAAREQTLPEDDPLLLLTRSNLAVVMHETGDLDGARVLLEAVLAARERTLPEDHPDLLMAHSNRAVSMMVAGDLAGARALQETVLAGRERALPRNHHDLLQARTNLARSTHAMGDRAAARALLPSLIGGMQARVLAALALAPRQALEVIAREDARLSAVLFLSKNADSAHRRGVFELTETLRLVAGEASRSLARFDRDPELSPILEQADSVRRGLNDLIAGTAREEVLTDVSAELTRLSLERDRLEREASGLLAERGIVIQPVEVDRLAAALDPGDVAVGYRRIGTQPGVEVAFGPDHLFAHVLTSDATLTRIDLGLASEIVVLAAEWRTALGAPISGGALRSSVADDQASGDTRGVSIGGGGGGDEVGAGRSLRKRVWDPVLAACGEDPKRLFVCADDFLFLLPLDALPLDNTERVGDRLEVINEVSFAPLLVEASRIDGVPSLLALGGVDYATQGLAPEGRAVSAAPIGNAHDTPSSTGMGEPDTSRSAAGLFSDIPQSGLEVEAIADLFEKTIGVEPGLLTGKETTKAALFDAATGKRYLHLATHGWFAPESVKSVADASSQGQSYTRMSLGEHISGLAPMTLCGLALAGANNGRDSLGRVPGILTAEELCSLDLSQCELAVLSACETNVGVRRAGQGIQSLQSALYAAGVRTSITSLWKVGDVATRRLMVAFYTKLWMDELGKADALWQAKMALRAAGHPIRDWAGWVLTGDPE